MDFHFAGIGTLINVAGIFFGGLVGVFGGKFLTEKFRVTLMDACALAVIFLGAGSTLSGLLKISGDTLNFQNAMLLIASLLIGSAVGGILDIDGKVERFGIFLRERSGNDGDTKFVEAFVTASLTVCIGAMAVIGAINDRLLHDPTILIAKSSLDMIIILVMAASLGKGCIFSCVSVGIFQGAITFFAGFLEPFMTEIALANLSTVGNVLIFAIGVNLLFPEKKIPVANFLPALIIACLWN
ncbi:MAG: DUF554 domain-containing protein [Selenomonadaceae bacterium]|nr:DUF554 domain-containing protein [Selenomonadaceae bacterium]